MTIVMQLFLYIIIIIIKIMSFFNFSIVFQINLINITLDFCI